MLPRDRFGVRHEQVGHYAVAPHALPPRTPFVMQQRSAGSSVAAQRSGASSHRRKRGTGQPRGTADAASRSAR